MHVVLLRNNKKSLSKGRCRHETELGPSILGGSREEDHINACVQGWEEGTNTI